MHRGRLVRVLVLASSMAVATASVALAADPIPWKRAYSIDNTQLTWKFAGTWYPQWLTDRVHEALETNWDDPATNNSRTAQFVYSDSGVGRVVFSSSINSPCNPVNAVWLASACTGGKPDWKIHVRNLDVSKYSNWHWIDKPGGCSGTCFQLRRTLIHEPIHLTGGGSIHSTQSADLTVFLKGQASNIHAIGRYYTLRQCDEAGAQKAYGLRLLAGPYSPCLGNLKTSLSASANVEACQGESVMVGGRLQLHAAVPYPKLAGNALAGRAVTLRVGTTVIGSVIATDAGGENWSRTFRLGTYGTRSYIARFDGLGTLVASEARLIAIAWLPHALCGGKAKV